MSDPKLLIGWDVCKVAESFDLMRCFNCSGYHHTANKCTSSVICPKCSGNHKIADCKSQVESCINCINVNLALKLNLDCKHAAWSRTCSVYLRKIDQERKRVDYMS